MTYKLRAVAGHAQLAQSRQGGQAFAEPDDARPHQRFAASQAQLAHAAGDKDARHPLDFFQSQYLLARQKAHVLRHAVDAAKIAAVGHRQA
ncbi:hypothetical protein D3C81_1865400 [compost metagenome]